MLLGSQSEAYRTVIAEGLRFSVDRDPMVGEIGIRTAGIEYLAYVGVAVVVDVSDVPK
jgi:hypothetical protein